MTPLPWASISAAAIWRSEEHTSELQSRRDLVCRLLLEKKNDLERAGRMLEAAQSRLITAGTITRTIVAVLSSQDDRLLFVIEAGNPAAARRLFSLSLLP